jgi:hypothetical protein
MSLDDKMNLWCETDEMAGVRATIDSSVDSSGYDFPVES